MTIKDVAKKINELAEDYRMSGFQELRKKIKNLSKTPSQYIFTDRTIFDKHKYAFHYGGRTELQYNIAEEDVNLFRYGVAFSLEGGKALQDPVQTLKPKILRANEFISKNCDRFSDMHIWAYEKGDRGETRAIQPIDERLVRDGNFIFIGKYIKKSFDKLTTQDYDEVLKTFDRLLELYEYVETGPAIEEKIARICWNDFNWQGPSGRYGKSQNTGSYEYKSGFGHEEWLLDTDKVINSFHYGYLQEIGHSWKKYEGKNFNISLYSINSETGERWWIGKIKNVKIISQDESERILSEYRKRGWLKEMIEQLEKVSADTKHFVRFSGKDLFHLKYKPDELELLDVPKKFSNNDTVVRSTYYSTLLNKTKEPELGIPVDKTFRFVPGHRQRKEIAKANYGERKKDITLFHNKMVKKSYDQLSRLYGKSSVGTEQQCFDSAIDLVIKDGNSFIFYEFKTSNSVKICIREALSQLLEYAYYPAQNNASKLVIVSQNKINEEAQKYLKKLRCDFKVPVYYKRYNPETEELDTLEY